MGITGAAMLIALALLFFLMSGFAESKIPEGVTAGGVNLSGLSREEASAALESMIRQDMTVQLPVGEFTLSSEYTQVSLDMDGLLEEALHQEKPAELSLRPWLILNEEALRKALITEIGEQEQAYSPAEARLEGTVPALNEQDFDPAIPCPTLTVQLGTPGTTASLDNLAALIADGYATATFRLDARELMQEQHPEAPDLAALRKEYSVEAVSAKVDPDTQEIIPGSYGLDFDIDAAEKLLEEAAPGEIVEIPMEYVTPEVLSGDVLFPDILGFCQTPHSDDEDRTHNLRLACAALNGVVLQPGETLSYNATLGQRTEEAGYKEAPAYSGTELVDSLGGGICQVSSTLYLCSLFAELETVERVSHGYPANYMPVGLDATVSWGSPDLKIKNSWDTPVKIVAEEQNGFVCIWLMGTETRDYYVRVGFGSSGTYARSKICKYDRETNTLISKEEHHLSGYLDEVTSVIGEIGPEQIYRHGLCRDQEIPAPTDETLEASQRHIGPNTLAP